MKLNVSRLRRETGAAEKFDFVLEQLSDLEGCEINDPVHIRGVVYNTGETIKIEAKVETVVKTQCDRCLEPVSLNMDFIFTEDYADEADADTNSNDNSELLSLEEDMIDLKKAVEENIQLNLPMRVLCNDDCPGICPKCGQNLKIKKCDCSDKFIDPRLEALLKFNGNDK